MAPAADPLASRVASPLAALSPAILVLRANGTVEIGSSTLVRIGPRFLLATAAHNVDDASDHELRIVPSGLSASAPLPFLRRSRLRRGDATDVAWIELAAETVANRGMGFVELAALGIAPARGGERFLVQGYPAQSVLLPRREGFPVQAMGFFTTASTTRAGEVAVFYPPRENGASPGGGEAVAPLSPPPHGISGGGIWSWPHGPMDAWSGDARLVAIARGWRRWRGTLHGTPIATWLARVAADFPELRRVLVSRQG